MELIKEIDKRYSKEPNEGLIEQLIEEKWNVFDASIVEIRRKAIVDKATQSGILNTNRWFVFQHFSIPTKSFIPFAVF